MYAPTIAREANKVTDIYAEGLRGNYVDAMRLAFEMNPFFGSYLSEYFLPKDNRTEKEKAQIAEQMYQGWNYAPLPPEYPDTQSELWYRNPDYGRVDDSSVSSFGRKQAFLKRK